MSAGLRILVVCLAVFGFATAVPAERQAPRAAEHVVLISLDGFPSWAMDDPYLPVPTLRALAGRGAIARTMRPVEPDRDVAESHHVRDRRPAGDARRPVQRHFGPRARRSAASRAVAGQERDGALADALRHRLRTGADDGAGRLGGDPERADDLVGVSRAAGSEGQIPQELVKAGVLSQAELETFHTRNIVWRDHVWTEAAAHIIRQHRPNLMLYHLLTLDSVHHRYGPRTPAAMRRWRRWTRTWLDSRCDRTRRPHRPHDVVRRVRPRLPPATRQIRLNAALRESRPVDRAGRKGRASADAYVVPEGGTAIVYVTGPDPPGAILARARQAIEGVEGVTTLVEPADYREIQLPGPSSDGQMGALFVIPRDGIRSRRRWASRLSSMRPRAASARTGMWRPIPTSARCSSPPAPASDLA